MTIKTVEYIGSFPSVQKCPEREQSEFAFIGRSNVGKSSLINMLTGRKALAKVSHTPGKTQMLNFYEVNEAWTLVDLPGYGYARLSKKHRQSLKNMIEGYLARRENMMCAFVLIDGYISPQKIDLEFVNWMGENGIPFALVFTKLDRMKRVEVMKNVEAFKAEMLKEWTALPPCFVTSSVSQLGKEEVLGYVDEILNIE